MTQSRILKLAWRAALDYWAKEDDILHRNPESEIAKVRTENAWAEVEELERLIREEEKKTA